MLLVTHTRSPSPQDADMVMGTPLEYVDIVSFVLQWRTL